MARNCPHCERSIDHLWYRCGTTGWESGTVNDAGDWDCNDTGTDDNHDYTYTYMCPECEHDIDDEGEGYEWLNMGESIDEEDVPSIRINEWTNVQ